MRVYFFIIKYFSFFFQFFKKFALQILKNQKIRKQTRQYYWIFNFLNKYFFNILFFFYRIL
jgi:hypothetical protein